MKYKFLYLIFFNLTIFNLYFLFQANAKKLEFQYKNNVTTTEEKLEQIEKLEKKLIKIYLNIIVRNEFIQNFIESSQNSDYSKILGKKEIEIIKRALLKKILALREERKFLKPYSTKIPRKIETLRFKKILYVINPLTGKSVKPGRYKYTLTSSAYIKSPITGFVKKISYKSNNISVIIENKKCQAFVSGLDDIQINIGNKVIAKEIIGSIKKPKTFSFYVKCK